jgi:hypothetical protein
LQTDEDLQEEAAWAEAEADEEETIDETDPEVIAARAEGKEKCPRCKRWMKDIAKNNHLYKCEKCPKCFNYTTNKPRHLTTCKGPAPDKVPKVKCPICPDMVHPQAWLRHIKLRHPEQAEKYRTRPADSKNRSEKRRNRKRFYEAHPDKVIAFLFSYVDINTLQN